MVPLLYMFACMQPTLPWSCEGFKKWATNLTEEEEFNLCNLYVQNETETTNSTNFHWINHHIPSVLYFKTLFNDLNLFTYESVEFSMSWQLILCAIFIWAIVIIVVYRFFNIAAFGQIVRCSVWTLGGLIILLLIRFSFLSGASNVFSRVVMPSSSDITTGFVFVPLFSLSAFGPGWGLFVALSSFNKFKTNIIKQSWIISLGQMAIILSLHLLTNFSEEHYWELTDGHYYSQEDSVWSLYLSTGSAMSHMAWPNLWSILFYFMLFLASMLLMIIQLYSILTSVFDEFVTLRERQMEVSMGIIALTAVLSLYFTSNHGMTYFTALATDTVNTQIIINLLLLLIVLWIYGRVRFQRDIEFMINERFSTWKINILRFVAPLGMLFVLVLVIYLAYDTHVLFSNFMISVYANIFVVLPLLIIPGYAAYSMHKSTGSLKMRLQRCCVPNDWYPVEPEDRQREGEAMGNTNITQQINKNINNVL